MMDARRYDIHIGVFREILNRPNCTKSSKELIEFILEDVDMSRLNRMSALLFLCQRIFEEDTDTFLEMQRRVIETLKKDSLSH